MEVNFDPLSLSRNEGETFPEYKERRKQMNLLTKIYKRYGEAGLVTLDKYLQEIKNEETIKFESGGESPSFVLTNTSNKENE